MSVVAFDPGAAQEVISVCAAVVAAGCAVFVAVRDDRWRKHGLAAQLSARIKKAEDTAAGWHDSDHGKEMRRKLERHDKLISEHSVILQHVATKTDVAKIEGALGRLEGTAEAARGGVDRIENLLMTRALAS